MGMVVCFVQLTEAVLLGECDDDVMLLLLSLIQPGGVICLLSQSSLKHLIGGVVAGIVASQLLISWSWFLTASTSSSSVELLEEDNGVRILEEILKCPSTKNIYTTE